LPYFPPGHGRTTEEKKGEERGRIGGTLRHEERTRKRSCVALQGTKKPAIEKTEVYENSEKKMCENGVPCGRNCKKRKGCRREWQSREGRRKRDEETQGGEKNGGKPEQKKKPKHRLNEKKQTGDLGKRGKNQGCVFFKARRADNQTPWKNKNDKGRVTFLIKKM